jgi:hypothetical protein
LENVPQADATPEICSGFEDGTSKLSEKVCNANCGVDTTYPIELPIVQILVNSGDKEDDQS